MIRATRDFDWAKELKELGRAWKNRGTPAA